MEDHFLYKLRNGQLQNNKGVYRTKKFIEYKKDGNINTDSQKQFSKFLEKIISFQKNTLLCLEKIAGLQENQTNAIIQIANTLKTLNETFIKKENEDNTYKHNEVSNSFMSLNKIKSTHQTKSDKKNILKKGLTLAKEKKTFKTIKNMRSNNQTWNSIASYLKKENISTLTGNGTWSPNLALYFYKKMQSTD